MINVLISRMSCLTVNVSPVGVLSPSFATRIIYNSHVNPAMVEAAFARTKKSSKKNV